MSLLLLGSGPGGAGGAAFTDPSSLSGLVLWLGANSGATIKNDSSVQSTNGGAVDEWLDQSSSGYDVASGTDAVYAATGFNSKPCIQFVAGDNLTRTAASSTNIQFFRADPFTVFISAMVSTVTTPQEFFSFYPSSSAVQGWSAAMPNGTSSPGFLLAQNVGGSKFALFRTTSTISNNTPFYYSVKHNGGGAVSNFAMTFNGGAESIISVADTIDDDWAAYTAPVKIPLSNNGGLFLRQVIVYNTALSDGDIALVNSWLATDGGFA